MRPLARVLLPLVGTLLTRGVAVCTAFGPPASVRVGVPKKASPSLPRCHTCTPTGGEGVRAGGSGRRDRSSTIAGASSEDFADLPPPPKDNTFSLRGRIRTILGRTPKTTGRRSARALGKRTEGIFRTKLFGFLTTTVMTSPLATEALAALEPSGDVDGTWPYSVTRMLGERSFTTMPESPTRSKIRNVSTKALAMSYIPNMEPLVQRVLEDKVAEWKERIRSKGKKSWRERKNPKRKLKLKLQLQPELESFTFAVINTAFFGAEESKAMLQFEDDFRKVTRGLFSVPVKSELFERLPTAARAGLKARQRIRIGLKDVVQRRREVLYRARRNGMKSDAPPEGSDSMLDVLLWDQLKEEEEKGGMASVEVLTPETILDTLVSVVMAGLGTTSASLSRMLQYLADHPDLREELVREGRDSLPSEALAYPSSRLDVFGTYPLLDAVFHESARLNPPVGGVFRKANRDFTYNGYAVPKDTSIMWTVLTSTRDPELHHQPDSFCPYRFITGIAKGDKKKGRRKGEAGGEGQELRIEPKPESFGFGRHLCPGRHLSKLEMVLFMTRFLETFDYELVKGQDLRGTPPSDTPRSKLVVKLSLKDED